LKAVVAINLIVVAIEIIDFRINSDYAEYIRPGGAVEK
jgi:hypothetical protein